MPWLFFLKASAEVESADHLYAVEDGVRFDNRISTGDHFRASPSPQRLLNESSSLLIAEADEYPSESHQQRYGSSRPYAIVVLRVEGILSRMLCIQNVEQ